MGTKYIIEVEDKPFELLSEDGFTSEKLFRVKGFNSLVFDWNGLNNLTPYTEPDLERVKADAYLKGLNDGQGVILESTQNNAFNNGYKKCLEDMEHDKGKENSIGYKIGYKKGYVDGLNRISDYEDKIRKEAYEKGFKDAAYNCEETCTLVAKARTEGYNEGQKAGERHGMKLAWEAARKICTNWVLSDSVLSEIFGMDKTIDDVMKENTASEAIEKIRQYEQEQEEIQVGDEVIRHYKSEFAEGDDAPSIFLSEEDGYFRCLAFNGRSIMIAEYPKNQYRKTGRHFHEIATILEKMRGEQDG